jgi:hypothetical protein
MKSKTLKHLLLGEFSVKRFVRSALLIYAVLCFYAFFLTDRQIFQPQPASYQETQATLKLKTTGGNLISATYLPNPQARYTILYSHGNAEDLGDIAVTLTTIHDAGFAVLLTTTEAMALAKVNPPSNMPTKMLMLPISISLKPSKSQPTALLP